MKLRNLFKSEDFTLDYFEVKRKTISNIDEFYYFALDGIDKFSIIQMDIGFCYSYPNSRRDLWERDLSTLKGDKEFTSGLYRIELSFRTIQELCEVYSWFISLGKYHVEPDKILWDNEGGRQKHQLSLKGIQKRKWFTIEDIKEGKDLVYKSKELDDKDWWKNVNYIWADWAGCIYLHVPITDIASGQFKYYMTKLKYDLGYKCDWSAPVEIRKYGGYSKYRFEYEYLII